MPWRRLASSVRDVPAKDLNVAAGAALTFLISSGTYVLVALTGVIVARKLGAHDRGVYSIVTTVALLYAAFAELGISKAGIYLIGQRRSPLPKVAANNLAWLAAVGGLWVAGCLALGLAGPRLLGGDLSMGYYVVFGLGGVCLVLVAFVKDLLIASGSVIAYNLVEFAEPFLRAALILIAVFVLGAGIGGVLLAWLLGIALAGALALRLLSARSALRPRFHPGLMRQQLSFGLRGYLGFVFQSVNYRLDVFLVASFLGSAALGHYAVAFGMAEMLWQIPFALGAVFFPKASALDPQASAEIGAVTCRRAVFITLMITLTLLASGRFLIVLLYGNEFSAAVNAFYILLPSASLYTVHKVLSSALAARGMPEASLYGGLVSFPITIGLGFLLIPRLGIEGAAIASVCAYAVNASVILFLFLRVTGRPLPDILFIRRADIAATLAVMRAFFVRSEAVAAE